MDLEDLKKEIPYKWRVQSANKYGANCVAYIDARDVQDLLDEVCSPMNWATEYKDYKGNLFCGIGIKDTEYADGEWTWKWDCGVESNVEKQKGEASDAFKRAAVMWGIGRFLYSKEIIKLPVEQKGTDFKGNPKYVPYSEKAGKFVYGDDITVWCNALTDGSK